MINFKKHLVFLYLGLIFVLVATTASKFILDSSNEIMTYVPEESDMVIELNCTNFINEISYQKIYKSDYFESKDFLGFSIEDETVFFNSGIELFSKIIAFRESWPDESVWFLLFNIKDQKQFKAFEKKQIKGRNVTFFNDYALVQMNKSSVQEKLDIHVSNITKGQVKSVVSKIVIEENFRHENELNIFFATPESDFISNGIYHVNFNDNDIEVNGYLVPIGEEELISPIKHKIDESKVISLRSSIDLLQSLHLFGNARYKSPSFNQFVLDYSGTTLLTINENIPIHIYPNLNLKLDIDNFDKWDQYFNGLAEFEDITLTSDTLTVNSQSKIVMKYGFTPSSINLFQKPNQFESKDDVNTEDVYFDFSFKPGLLVDKTFFKKDEKNPPKMFANLKISVIQSVINEFNYLKDIEYMNFKIYCEEKGLDYQSKGRLVFTNKQAHSIIESLSLFQNFTNTLLN